jgi:polyphosphate glucokinase
MNVLAIDTGGTHMKILATGQKERREFESGPKLTPKLMVAGVKKLARDWSYDVVSMGYPGPVQQNRPIGEPHNLAKGLASISKRPARNACSPRLKQAAN